jgi:hypothetical protein
VDQNGAIDIEQPIGTNVWTYNQAVDPRDLAQLALGPNDLVSAQHTIVKVQYVCAGVETQYVTRVTTVVWKDAAGTTQTRQFVSMHGVHTRSVP